MTNGAGNRGNTVWKILGLLIWLAVIVLILIFAPEYGICAWILAVGLLIVLFKWMGYAYKDCWYGILIDERNKVSLSRFQITLWTLVFLSAILVAVLINIIAGRSNPLEFTIPTEAWALMGISATSLVGASLLKLSDPKRSRLYTKGGPSLKDMFMGEEIGSHEYIDMSKVQMFFFTLIAVLVYSVSLGAIFVETSTHIRDLPPFHESLLIIIGISHAGYLTYKVVPNPTALFKKKE